MGKLDAFAEVPARISSRPEVSPPSPQPSQASAQNGSVNVASDKNLSLEYSVDIVGLSKRFRRRTVGRSGYTTLKSALLSGLRACLPTRNGNGSGPAVHFTTVLENLTLRIPRGSSVGVIGKNGSGKSSFLKLITGIYKPDTGTVRVNGRLAALIELGAGFHPDFSGRENVYLGGVMYGLSRAQIDSRFDDIVRFAELEEVIDDPVRTYSSGMFMRLGFSLAIHTDPDVLLIDEVLAVGDAAFHAKCRDHLAAMRRDGKTLLLVSHDLEAVERWSDEVIWLHEGRVRDRGEPRRVIDHYRQFIERGEERELFDDESRRNASTPALASPSELESTEPVRQRWGSRELEIVQVRLADRSGEPRRLFHPNDGLVLEVDYKVHHPSNDVVFGVGITRSDGVLVHGTNTAIERIEIPPLGAAGTLTYSIESLALLDGSYRVDVAVHREDGYPYDYHQGAINFAVRSPERQVGVYLPQHRWAFSSRGVKR